MEMRDFALALLESPTLEGKLRPPPEEMTDGSPGAALRVLGPIRPADLSHDPVRKVKVPRISGMSDVAQRVRILHALANHELQAAELFAWALLAFPEMPAEFRAGCLGILADEQRHCRLYMERLHLFESHFGAFPITMMFWHRAKRILTPLQFVCTMGLTFESANLDFAREHADAARQAGDEGTALAIEEIHRDEVGHVAFAWKWFQCLKQPDQDDWTAYCENVAPPLGPARARGGSFDRTAREQAGLHRAFIEHLADTLPTRAGGSARQPER